MLKVLPQTTNSDDETEFQINDRFSFWQFLGLKAGCRPEHQDDLGFQEIAEKDQRCADVNCSKILAGC